MFLQCDDNTTSFTASLSSLMILWVTAVVSELGTTLHPAATCGVRAASVLGPRWAFCSKDTPPLQDSSNKGKGLIKATLRAWCAFCAYCCGIMATVGHLIPSWCLCHFTLNKKEQKRKSSPQPSLLCENANCGVLPSQMFSVIYGLKFYQIS